MIHKLAQFLLINSEAIPQKGLKGKMSLIYFFFTYSKTHSKKHYEHFAFEILENILMEELSIIENGKREANSEIAGIGWSLIKLIEHNYFESDDLEDILAIVDKAAFLEVERLSRTDFKSSYFIQLISLGLYLKERINLSKSNGVKVLEIKEYLLITFFELTTNIHLLPRESMALFGLCRVFFDEGANHKMVSHFCVDGLKKLDKIFTEVYNKEIIENYKALLEKETFESILVYNSFFSDVVKNYMTDSLINIEDYANRLMKDLYLESEHGTNNNLQKLLVIGIYLKNQDKEVEQKSFHLYLLGFLLNSIENA